MTAAEKLIAQAEALEQFAEQIDVDPDAVTSRMLSIAMKQTARTYRMNAQADLALRERANALLHQIDIGDYVDSEGHALKNNIAVLTLMKALTNV